MSIVYHHLKHHLSSIKSFMLTQCATSSEAYLQQLKRLGASQFDLYTGLLTSNQAVEEVFCYLQKNNCAAFLTYAAWIHENGGFQNITLSDTSIFTLRFLNDPKLFIHVHPARYSPHTLRIKANAMKSAIVYAIKHPLSITLELETINQIRAELSLSPIRSAVQANEINKCLNLLMNA
jgi:hypothetical protein